MNPLRSLSPWLTVALFGVAACDPASDDPSGRSAPLAQDKAAILGTQRPATLYPEAVTIRVNNSFADFCTGVIVAPRVVLTAAHCVVFNPNSTWTLVAPFAGMQSRTAATGEPIDPAFASVTRSNFNTRNDLRDLGLLYLDVPFENVPVAILSPTRFAANTGANPVRVSAVGRSAPVANAGLALSVDTPLLWPTAGDFYMREYSTLRITTPGDSGGPLFVEGTHKLVGTERVYDATRDYWAEIYGATFDAVQAKIAAHGGFSNIAPNGGATPPLGALGFSVTAGAGGTYAWSLASNGSGGGIDAATGSYRAGAVGNVTDVVRVTDVANNVTTVNVSVGAAVSIAPASGSVAPKGSIALAAAGGSGAGYVWAFAQNLSGGTLSATGAYQAGGVGGVTDVARVTDSLGNTQTINIVVSAALALTPAATTVAPRGSVVLAAAGGVLPYAFTLETNASQATLSANSYTAGSLGEVTDIVRVTDANGAEARSMIKVTATLTINPPFPSAPVLGSLRFNATGGSGTGYVWGLDKNESGAQLSAAGDYVAGAQAKTTDVVRVTDSLGNIKTATVIVGGALSIESPLSAAAPIVAPMQRLTLVGRGGSGKGYQWSLTNNRSGGSVDASGVYVAGKVGSTADEVALQDDAGARATLTLNVGPGVTLSPQAPKVAFGGTLTLVASGGSNMGYSYTFVGNRSNARLSNNMYTAGTVAGTDRVRATDSLGNTGETDVSVGATAATMPSASSSGTMPGAASSSGAPAQAPDVSGESSGCACKSSGGSALSPTSLIVALTLSLRLTRKKS
jgi:V8-like Glu-specific endopeptidase